MPVRHDPDEHIALVEILDRVLGKGAVIAGEVVLSVADIDLVRLELQLVLGSVDTLDRGVMGTPGKVVGR